MVVKASKSSIGRSRISFVWVLSLVASVWSTPLVISLVGDQSLVMLALAYAVAVTGIAVFLAIRRRKIPAQVAQEQKVPESLPQQLA